MGEVSERCVLQLMAKEQSKGEKRNEEREGRGRVWSQGCHIGTWGRTAEVQRTLLASCGSLSPCF